MEPTIGNAIWALVKNKATSYTFNATAIEEWDISTAPTGEKQPTQEAIDAKLVELKVDYDSKKYARDRKEKYNELNQFELMYDDKINSTNKWSEAIAKIKKDIPKS